MEKKLTKKSDESQEEQSFHVIKRKKVMHFENERTILRKGPLYDSLDDEELEDEEDINRFYIDPKSNFSFFFDLILFIISIITFFEIPLYLAMNLNFCKAQRFSFNDIINILNECKIPNIKICNTNDKGNLYIFKIGNIQFSFHDEKIINIDSFYQSDMVWDRVKKQPCASTIFNNCTDNKNVLSQVTTTGKPIKILINKLIDDYHKKILTFDEIIESI